MSKNDWSERRKTLDAAPFQAVKDAVQGKLEGLETNLRAAEQEREGLYAKAPDLQKADEEAMLSGPEAEEMSGQDLSELLWAIERAEKRIKVIRETMSRERSSPEIEVLAMELWEAGSKHLSALLDFYPEAGKELREAEEAYRKVERKAVELSSEVARLEKILNQVASPFMKEGEKRYQPAAPKFQTLVDPVMYAGLLGIPVTVNPGILNQPKADAASALAILKGEQ